MDPINTPTPRVAGRQASRTVRLIQRKDSPVYLLEYRHRGTGKRMRVSTNTTDPLRAEEKRAQKEHELGGEALRLTTVATPAHLRVTVNDVLDHFLAQYRLRGRKSVKTTVSGLKLVRAELGETPALELTPTLLMGRMAAWKEQGIANGTTNLRVTNLRTALRQAVAAGLLPYLPPCSVPRLPDDNVREGFFEADEYEAMREALAVNSLDLRDVLDWGYRTGMRRGEILALTWDGFTRETWSLRLPGRSAKSGRMRTIMCPPGTAIHEVLRRRLKARRLDCPYVFHRSGKRIRKFDDEWLNAWRRTGLPMRTTRKGHPAAGRIFHDLRRTAVRNMIRARVGQATVMAITGHRTTGIFLRYDIVNERDVAAAFRQTDAYVRTLPRDAQDEAR